MAYGDSNGNRSHNKGGGRSYGSRPMKSSTGYKRRDNSGGGYRGSSSDGGSDRPRYDNDRTKYERSDKPRYDRTNSGGDRPRYNRDEDRSRSYQSRDQSRDQRSDRYGSSRGESRSQDRYPRRDDSRGYQRLEGGDRPYRTDRGQDRPYGDRTDSGKPRYGNGDKSRYSRDDKPQYRDSKPRYGDRDSTGGKPRYGDRTDSGSRHRYDRDGSGQGSGYGDRSGSRPYSDRSGGKPYGDRSGGKSYSDRGSKPDYRGDRPYRSDREGGYSDKKPRYTSGGGDSGGYDRKPRYSGSDRGGSSDRPNYGDRSRSGYGDRDRSGGKSYGDRSGGKSYGDRSDRKPYGDRSERKPYGDRGGKPFNRDQGDRPSYRDDRESKPSYREDRGGKPSYREDRGDRPSYRDDQGGKSSYRGDRDGKPSYRGDRGSRPSYRDDRGGKGYSDREGGRPYREGGRDQKAYRDWDSSDRYPRRDREESSYRPGQWADGSRDRDREGTYPKDDSRPRYDAERRSHAKPWDREGDEYQSPRPGLEPREDEPPVPVLDEDVKMPKGMRAELKSLDLETAREVGAYLMTAGQLIDTDPELAYRHAEAARRRAARLPITREATAETAYAAGLYEEALSQYKTLRRMTGSPDLIPVTVDCLRAVGKYRDALELAEEGTREIEDPAMRIELLIVTAGVRVDMGQREEAMRLLRREIDKPTVRHPRLAQARLLYAYSDLLAQSGDMANARRGFAMAARLDPEGETAALDRLDEMDGLVLDLDESEFIDFGEDDYVDEDREHGNRKVDHAEGEEDVDARSAEHPEEKESDEDESEQWDDVESDTWDVEDELDEDEDDVDSGTDVILPEAGSSVPDSGESTDADDANDANEGDPDFVRMTTDENDVVEGSEDPDSGRMTRSMEEAGDEPDSAEVDE